MFDPHTRMSPSKPTALRPRLSLTLHRGVARFRVRQDGLGRGRRCLYRPVERYHPRGQGPHCCYRQSPHSRPDCSLWPVADQFRPSEDEPGPRLPVSTTASSSRTEAAPAVTAVAATAVEAVVTVCLMLHRLLLRLDPHADTCQVTDRTSPGSTTRDTTEDPLDVCLFPVLKV